MNPAQSSADDSPQNEKSSSGNIYAEYHHKDHLGNVRVAFTDRNDDHFVILLGTANYIEITQQLDYYPFGLQQQGQGLFHTQQEPGNRYRFNGIEHSEETGLDLAFYRSYNPTLGRWMQTDPAASSFARMSPYTGMGNNPLRYTDPNGDFIAPVLVGGFLNVGSQWLQGNVTNWQEGLAYFAVGAASGVAVSTGNLSLAKGLVTGGNKAVQIATGKLKLEDLATPQGLISTGLSVMGDLALPEQTLSITSDLKSLWDGAFKTTSSGGGQTIADGKGGATLSEPVTASTSATSVDNKGYTFTETAAKHFDDTVSKYSSDYWSKKSRPYMNSPLTIQEIMSTGAGLPDATFPGGVNWKVPGAFRGNQGLWELGLNPETKLIYHFVFKSL